VWLVVEQVVVDDHGDLRPGLGVTLTRVFEPERRLR